MRYFNRNTILAACLSGSLMLTSCTAIQNANNTQKGVAIGAAGGAVLGGILGNNIGKGGNGALGAVLGGIIGGAAGGYIGNRMDKQAKEISQALPGAEVERVAEGIKLTLHENTVNFAFDSSNLTPQAKSNLDKLVEVFKQYPDTNLSVFGYTDSVGKDDYNLKLSERRANSVIAYLVSNGISRSRLSAKGLGEANPVASNETTAGRAQNRRVEFAITANEKMKAEAKAQTQQ